MNDKLEARVTELECRVLLQEETIETLGRRLHEQAEQLAALQAALQRQSAWLREHLPATAFDPEQEIPPHY